MQSIRRKIKLIIVLLAVAAGVATVIYKRHGFEFGVKETSMIAYCGNTEEYTGSAAEGKRLFQENCASCHSMENIIVGPALRGVVDRVPSKKFIETFLFDPDKTIKTNIYARNLFEQYERQKHTNFKGTLAKDDIASILAYLKAYKTVGVVAAD